MASEQFDLLVIGGGIHGAGVARDAALRGLKVALVEKGDFASGTSSKSSKLIHGGLRYLERFEFGLVRESCRERRILQDIAPHLVKPLPFLIPIYKDDPRPPWMIGMGLTLYDLLAPMMQNLRGHQMLSSEEALRELPELRREGLVGAAEYWDCRENDARFCLANVVDAAAHGASCANHVEAVAFSPGEGRIEYATVRDCMSDLRFDVRAKAFVNAGGPWVDRIAGRAGPAQIELRRTKGVHVVTRRLTRFHALLLQTRRDGRVFFVIPWAENHSLIGTTDTDFAGDLDQVEIARQDIEYLIEEARHALPSAELTDRDVLSAFAGLRPLLQQPGRAPSDVTRRHKLVIAPNGLISIVGGKYTTYRAVSEEVVDLICRSIPGTKGPCQTACTMLAPEFLADLFGGHIEYSSNHPSRWERETPEEWTARILPHAVRYSVTHEMAMTVHDFLFRRTNLGYTCPNLDPVARRVADEMQKLLNWPEDVKSRLLGEATRPS